MKVLVAKFFYFSGLGWLAFFLSRLLYGPHIRVVNYHGTPSAEKENFREHLKWYKRWYSSTGLEDLRSFLNNGKHPSGRSGLIISFDDGKRNNFDVAKGILEEHGFCGWFFIPVGWLKAGEEEQRRLQKDDSALIEEYKQGRVIMSVEEVKILMQGHVIGCHTSSHHRMKVDDTEDVFWTEIINSMHELEDLTGVDYRIFCWVGGEFEHYTRSAAEAISKAGYEFSFTTNSFPVLSRTNRLRLERSNIETCDPIPMVLFQLSGLMDLYYSLKRYRLRHIFLCQP